MNANDTHSPFSLASLEQTANGQPDANGFVKVRPDELSALIEAVNALDVLYEDEWRMSASWGDHEERREITERVTKALYCFTDRGMDSPTRIVRYDGEFELAWLTEGEMVMSAGDGSGACIIVGQDGNETRVNVGDKLRVPK